MAEGGLIEGALGAEEALGEGPGARGGAGFAEALALGAGAASPEARDYLRKASALLDSQLEDAAENRRFELSTLRGRRLFDRLKLAFQLLVALVALLVALGFVVMLHDAFTSQSVVVESFDAPKALEPRGLTGRVVAGGVLDELTRLQTATRSSAAKRNLSNAWSGDIKVEVPETGVSIGEIDRLLKARFGHDLHIGGDLVLNNTQGLELTVRGDDLAPKTFSGPQEDLAKLYTQAAEYIYGTSQPALFAGYLSNAGRDADAVAFAKAHYPSVAAAERPGLLNAWGNSFANVGGSPLEVLGLYQEAIRQKPDFWVGYNNAINGLWILGREEDAWREGQRMQALAGGRPGKAPELYYQNPDVFVWNLPALLAVLQADSASHAGVGTGVATNSGQIADVQARMHDPAAADFTVRTFKADATDPTISAMEHFVRAELAADRGDTQAAFAEGEAFGAAYANPVVSSNYPGYTCWLAPWAEAAGHPDRADVWLAKSGRFVDCGRFRGDILDHRGDWPGAQRAYAAAVALAPDLPAGLYSWGVALARHGDLKGAAEKLAQAHAKGPTWADPLKAWGDVLLREGDRTGARAKYDEALKLSPAWSALKAARAAAG